LAFFEIARISFGRECQGEQVLSVRTKKFNVIPHKQHLQLFQACDITLTMLEIELSAMPCKTNFTTSNHGQVASGMKCKLLLENSIWKDIRYRNYKLDTGNYYFLFSHLSTRADCSSKESKSHENFF